ncbi:MAG: amidohydrolase family protein, partial [Myxococcota bacterium]
MSGPAAKFGLRSERVAVDGRIGPATVVIDGAQIAAVLGPGEPPAPDVPVTDVGGDLVVPGLIDAHTHLFLDGLTGSFGYERALLASAPVRTLRAAASARRMLDFGFTTVRDVCTEGAGYADVALAQAIRDGQHEGPRIVPSGPGIGITGGYMPNQSPGGCLPNGCAVCDGVEAARREVRAQVASGVAWIKVFADWPCRPAPGHRPEVCPTFTRDELAAICDEAGRRGGRRVAAHVTSDAGARQAIDCGAASLEHLAPMSRETFDRAAARGVFVVPTLSIVHHGPDDT